MRWAAARKTAMRYNEVPTACRPKKPEIVRQPEYTGGKYFRVQYAGQTVDVRCADETAALFLARRNEARSSAPAAVLAIMLLAPAAMAVVTAGCLSPEVVREERLAFYTLTKTISILPVMERFEPVLSAALFLGMFCMAALLADSCAQTASRAAGRRKKKWEAWAVCAAALALSKPVRAMPEAVWSAGAVAFWGLAPILAQVVVGIKKVKKKAKKGLTNAGDFGNIAERSREGSRSDVRLEQNRRKDEKSS